MRSGFEFATAQRIVFGVGSLRELAPTARNLGRRALVVMGRSFDRAAGAIAALEAAGIRCEVFHTVGEPTVGLVQEGAAAATAARSEMVISVGGGSAIDAGKAIAALTANPGELRAYLEIVGEGRALEAASRPFIAIPTTAGTGSEVTRNAVLTVPEQRLKVSLRGPTLLPRLALVDPELTYGAPRDVTAAAGMDAFTQLIEPFVCRASNAITDALCRDGIERAAHSIRVAYADGANSSARADMALAAMLSGMALANAKLGAAHGFAGPIGGLFEAPHGAVCGRLLPAVVRANVAALRRDAPNSEKLERYHEVARLLTGDAAAVAENGADWLEQLASDLRIPPLAMYGMTRGEIPEVIERAASTSSMRGNPIALSFAEQTAILEAAL